MRAEYSLARLDEEYTVVEEADRVRGVRLGVISRGSSARPVRSGSSWPPFVFRGEDVGEDTSHRRVL